MRYQRLLTPWGQHRSVLSLGLPVWLRPLQRQPVGRGQCARDNMCFGCKSGIVARSCKKIVMTASRGRRAMRTRIYLRRRDSRTYSRDTAFKDLSKAGDDIQGALYGYGPIDLPKGTAFTQPWNSRTYVWSQNSGSVNGLRQNS